MCHGMLKDAAVEAEYYSLLLAVHLLSVRRQPLQQALRLDVHSSTLVWLVSMYNASFCLHSANKGTFYRTLSSFLHSCCRRWVFGQPTWESYHLMRVSLVGSGLDRARCSASEVDLWDAIR